MMPSWTRQPRFLYAMLFAWISITGGRFLSIFLELHGATKSSVGALLGIQQVMSLLMASGCGRLADELERRYPHVGRLLTIGGGALIGSVSFCLHAFVPNGSSWWYLVLLRLWYALAVNLVFPALDGICLNHCKVLWNSNTNYGKERLYGAVSWAISHVGLGLLMDHDTTITALENRLYTLSIVCTILVLCGLSLYGHSTAGGQDDSLRQYQPVDKTGTNRVVLQRDDTVKMAPLEDDKAGENEVTKTATPTTSTTWELFCSLVRAGQETYVLGSIFLLTVLIVAAGQSIVDSLIFLYFKDLQASYNIMGYTVVLTVLFEIPVFQISDALLQTMGTTGLLITSMLCYIVRVIGYTFIPAGKVYYVYFLEPLHGITYACSQTAIVEFVSCHTPQEFEATGQSFVYLIRGAGSIVGLLLGGWCMDHFGAIVMYRSAAVMVGTACLGLTAVSVWYYRETTQRTVTNNGMLHFEHIELTVCDALELEECD